MFIQQPLRSFFAAMAGYDANFVSIEQFDLFFILYYATICCRWLESVKARITQKFEKRQNDTHNAQKKQILYATVKWF